MKKIIALFLVIAVSFSITACRAGQDSSVSGTTTSATSKNSENTSQKITTTAETSTETTTSTTLSVTTPATSATEKTATTVEKTSENTSVCTTEAQKTSAKPSNKAERNIENFKGKKLIAITFDDGPYTPVTTSLLERLDKYDARVTFFVLGSRLDGNKNYRNTMKKAYEMGNQIASHTYSHSDLTRLSDAELKKEIDKANASVKNVIGIEPDAIRPPYGATNAKVEKAMNKHIIIWSIDPQDWKYRNADTVCNNIVNHAFDGGIVLLHDLYQTSVDGAIKAMEKLQKKGYAFVTVDELAKLRGVEMNTKTKYFHFKPENN